MSGGVWRGVGLMTFIALSVAKWNSCGFGSDIIDIRRRWCRLCACSAYTLDAYVDGLCVDVREHVQRLVLEATLNGPTTRFQAGEDDGVNCCGCRSSLC